MYVTNYILLGYVTTNSLTYAREILVYSLRPANEQTYQLVVRNRRRPYSAEMSMTRRYPLPDLGIGDLLIPTQQILLSKSIVPSRTSPQFPRRINTQELCSNEKRSGIVQTFLCLATWFAARYSTGLKFNFLLKLMGVMRKVLSKPSVVLCPAARTPQVRNHLFGCSSILLNKYQSCG